MLMMRLSQHRSWYGCGGSQVGHDLQHMGYGVSLLGLRSAL